jgi:hypothetical protein
MLRCSWGSVGVLNAASDPAACGVSLLKSFAGSMVRGGYVDAETQRLDLSLPEDA